MDGTPGLDAEMKMLTQHARGEYARITFKDGKQKMWVALKKKGNKYTLWRLRRDGALWDKDTTVDGIEYTQQELTLATDADILKIEPAHLSRMYCELEIIK